MEEVSGAGTASDGVFRRQTDDAEQCDEDQIGDEKRAAAVGAHLCREAPHIGHAHGRAQRADLLTHSLIGKRRNGGTARLFIPQFRNEFLQ